MLCRKCGRNFEGTGIYCPGCSEQPVNRSETENTRMSINTEGALSKRGRVNLKKDETLLGAVLTSRVFLVATAIFSVAILLDLFGVISYFASIDEVMADLGVKDFLKTVVPGLNITAFAGIFTSVALCVGMWLLVVFPKRLSTERRFDLGLKVLRITALVKYIFSIALLIGGLISVFILYSRWTSVFEMLGFTHLMFFAIIAVAGVFAIVGLLNLRICIEIKRNIKEVIFANENYTESIDVTYYPIVFYAFFAIAFIVLAGALGNTLMLICSVVKLAASVLFTYISIRLRSKKNADLSEKAL